ncbi:hypothetical protein RHMOL_Rhmol04G0379900 [Rhododendron molle]|uniref:Uncharacterized protein n=1 Tax=Rhododendron molle TaxID=49168 RepID=A0ACC0PA47_RHOML|nr:hypothetical protein RHMOL_Rhmol04G0379900 [Rhododendron molle]
MTCLIGWTTDDECICKNTEKKKTHLELYRECLRRAKYVGSRQHNTELVVDMVRQQFRKHMHETNPDKIQKLKDDAARGLINHILYESEKMSGRKFSQNS